ncbi:MAG: transporter substrate-binding domain-containing protein [Oscillospiraceae bacterium]|nr:transporter substrate-binding domain-containing protein [Oscillospiraceae bacterium]
MKKILVLLLSVVMVASLLAGCASSSNNAPAPQESATTEITGKGVMELDQDNLGPILTKIKETGVINAGIWGNSPTFSFHRVVDGKDTYAGFEYQMIVELAKRLSVDLQREVKVEFYEAEFSGMMAALEADQLMFIPELSPTDERKETWLFTDVYHRSNECYVALKSNADNPKFTGTLEGVTVAGSMGGIDVVMTRAWYPDAEIVELDSSAIAIMNVLSGKSDLACMNAVNAAMFAKANADLVVVDKLSFTPTDEYDKGCGFCMKYGNEDFAAYCNQYFKDIKAEGVWDQWINEATEQLDADVLAEFTVE